MALVHQIGSPDFFITYNLQSRLVRIEGSTHTIYNDGSPIQQLAQDPLNLRLDCEAQIL